MFIEPTRLPAVRFAHTYSAERYENRFEHSRETVEVSFVSEGTLTMTQNGAAYTAKKGDIFCLPHDLPTEIRADGCHSHHTVCAAVDWRESPDGLLLPPLTKDAPGAEEIRTRIDAFIFRPYLYENAPVRAAADFLAILCKIDELARASLMPVPEGSLLSFRAKKYIHANLRRPIRQAEVAAYLGVTPQYLCHVFRASEGETLMRYVNRAKLRLVRSLMENEHLPLCEAARLCGFQDADYASHLYRRLFGTTITGRRSSRSDGAQKP